jgi:CTP:molybdopterin cytidylyltransferase MocA
MERPATGHGAPAPYAVVLAAGAGVRFGEAKLLAPFRGKPLVVHAATTVAKAIADGILAGGVVIVRPGDAELARQLELTGVGQVENSKAASGLASSIKRGLGVLEAWPSQPQPGAALIVLADQPLVELDVIARLVAAWRRIGKSVRPRYAENPEEPGHPVLLDRELWPMAHRLEGDHGLGALFRANTDAVKLIDVSGTNPDVDTPEELHNLETGSTP